MTAEADGGTTRGPGEWSPLSEVTAALERHSLAVAEGPDDAAPATWVLPRDLLARDGAALRAIHARLAGQGSATPAAAAKWTLSWTAGAVAEAVGFVLATTGAGLLVDTGEVRLRMATGGWADLVRPVDARLVVPVGHPWEGAGGVTTVRGDADVDEATLRSLVAVVEPFVEAARHLARVGRRALWSEVADSLGGAVAFDPQVPVAEATSDRLARALRPPAAPWARRPRLGVSPSAVGPFYVMQRAGCCLAYQCDQETADDEALDDDVRAYRERFPVSPGEPAYCSTCSLRDPADCDARRLFWVERRRLVTAPA
ncbi:MAG: hypothetical protein ACFCVG_08075 [Kineosporiaceae bacterium]